jgi:hypothetical protein
MKILMAVNPYVSDRPDTIKNCLNSLNQEGIYTLKILTDHYEYDTIMSYRLVKTAKDFGHDNSLPFLKSIMTSLKDYSEPFDYVGYTNCDILFKPNLNSWVSELANKGYNSFIFAREDISKDWEGVKPYFGRDAFIIHKSLLPLFDTIPDFIIGEPYWDLYVYNLLLKNSNMYDDRIFPTITQHVFHENKWNDPNKFGYKWNKVRYDNMMNYMDHKSLLKTMKEVDFTVPFIDYDYDRELHIYNPCHLGDCILQVHITRKMIQKNGGILFHFYAEEKYHIEIAKHIGVFSPLIILHNLEDAPTGAFNTWVGTDKFYYEDRQKGRYNEMYVRFCEKLCRNMSIVNPITDKCSMLFDNEEILRNNKMSKIYDILFINSSPKSGQFMYEKEFDEMVINLSKNKTVITTKKLLDVPCTTDYNLSLLDIGNLSLYANRIIAIHTAPIHATFNIWNQKRDVTWSVFDKMNGFTYNERIKRYLSVKDFYQDRSVT